MRTKLLIMRLFLAMALAMALLPAVPVTADTIDSHTVVLDETGKIIPWTADPALGYDHVMNLSWNYLVSGVPVDSTNGKPFYYSYSCMIPETLQPADWPHNPAGLYGMLTESALKYYGYSGDAAPVNLAMNVATAMLANGMTPPGANWANVPYASGDAGSLIYHGAAFGDITGQGDGTGVLEPDKVGEMGYAWLQLYRFGGNTSFRDAAIAAADALAAHVRPGNAVQSPWPFRVYAETGVAREEYGANVIAPIRLFDALISLGLGNTAVYQAARQTAWDWMMAYPMQNNIWANYFEDMLIQPDTRNITQYNALMTARYLLEHPEMDPLWENHVRGLIAWVESYFAITSYGANTITIAEQMEFLYPMGSHTARYASVNALLYEATGDAAAREKAYRSLNWATYMARDNGIVIDGPDVPFPNHVWFTDGYGDYVRHFMTALGAVPEWAPAGQSHLVRSSSIVTNITYSPTAVSYTTSDGASTDVLRLFFTPAAVTVDGQALSKRADLTQAGWTFDATLNVVRIRHESGTNVLIVPETLAVIAVTPANSSMPIGAAQQFTATGTYSGGSAQNLSSQAAWASSDTSVATVGSTGLVTAKTAGSATISATLNGITGSAALTVQPAPLAVTTASLPGGSSTVPYTATLAAGGGTAPYSWSIVPGTGSLPGGLSLGSSTGVISGTPAVGGTFTFTVQASDAGIPPQTATRALSITIAAQAFYSIWPSALPVIGDSGPDSAVELGVKFRSDSNGFITGVRFYKASANSGTHIGNLWSSSGTRLATATFSGETASGWQQVNFTTPVAIAANTVYIASYHTNTGHYSCDQYYFATAGVDNPPLHAPANGVSGVNGVYAYGSASSFPSLGWRSSNYWVDVVLSTVAPPPVTLSSIAVTPAGQTIQAGATLQFTATGTYSDGTARNLSSQVTWASSNTGVATISSAGLATARGAGSSAISATLGAITGSATLTVQVPLLAITTASLPGGTLAVPYSATLAAGGGTAPYSWTIVAGTGALPDGLSLDSVTGIISGTPTAAGTFGFTVQARDAGTPQQIATRTLSIIVALPSTLSSIAVTPAGQTLQIGATLQFTATGTYSDGTARNLSSQAAWASSDTSVATINSTGLATARGAGSSAISATLGGITGSANLTVAAAPPPASAPVLDVVVTTKQAAASRTISSPSFSTAKANELLVAFIDSDGPSTGSSQSISSVTGGGLTWTRRARANAQAGTSEIWQARATNAVKNVIVKATRSNGSYQGMITVAAFQGASLTVNGAVATASAATGAPTVALVTTKANSVVWGTGNDWDRAVARTVSPNQTKLSEYLAPADDTLWVQYLTAPVIAAGTTATISCTAPTGDRWNLAAIEIVPQ